MIRGTVQESTTLRRTKAWRRMTSSRTQILTQPLSRLAARLQPQIRSATLTSRLIDSVRHRLDILSTSFVCEFHGSLAFRMSLNRKRYLRAQRIPVAGTCPDVPSVAYHHVIMQVSTGRLVKRSFGKLVLSLILAGIILQGTASIRAQTSCLHKPPLLR